MIKQFKNLFSKKDKPIDKVDIEAVWQQDVLAHLTALNQSFSTNTSILQTDLQQDVTDIISDLTHNKNLGTAGRLSVKRLLTRIGRHEYDKLITLTAQDKELIAALSEINTNGETGIPGGLTRF